MRINLTGACQADCLSRVQVLKDARKRLVVTGLCKVCRISLPQQRGS